MSETVDDIVREMRNMERHTVGGIIPINPRRLADLIEAAVKHQFREVTKTIPHEEVAVAESATTTPTCEKSSQVGDMAAMREALNVVIDSIRAFDKIRALKFPKEIKSALENMAFHAVTALAKPPRNCDVGTPEEQEERFKRYCPSGDCKRWVCNSYGYEKLFRHKCALIWGQLPYKKGATHEQK